MGGPFETRGFELAPWQQDAVRAWTAGADRGFTGTVEVFTGGGKTLIALACAAAAALDCNCLQVLIVVPTESLLDQWYEKILAHTTLTPEDIGRLGAGWNQVPADWRCLLCVLNTAAKRLPEMIRDPRNTMLIIDECHRAGAPSFSRVLDTPARYRIGLSATPDREEVDDDGMPIEYDEQLVGRSLGGLVYRFSLREARHIGWLPEYELNHHGVQLTLGERRRYEEETRRIDDLADRLAEHGIEPGRARQGAVRNDSGGAIARAYVAATALRKDLLYRAVDRKRVAARLVADAFIRKPEARILLFHERVDEATELYNELRDVLPNVIIALEHSRMSSRERTQAITSFRSGEAPVLVSVKSLIEGLDVPEADFGISVASSASVRQRVQSLGRVLRRKFDSGPAKRAEMHLIYVADSVDESIYGKEDWSDLTGEGRNIYWVWPREVESHPSRIESPPRTPVPTEDQEWARIGRTITSPVPWHGSIPWHEYSVDVRGNVSNPFGKSIANSQGVDQMITEVRGRPGGRFFVTPTHRLILTRDATGTVMLAGQLREPFRLRETDGQEARAFDVSCLSAGDAYDGPTNDANGTYKLSQKRGGVIERRNADRSTDFALTSGSPSPSLEDNARSIIRAWRSVVPAGMPFHLNHLWHAWYQEAGQPKFLGMAEGGFAWPGDHLDERGSH